MIGDHIEAVAERILSSDEREDIMMEIGKGIVSIIL